MENAMENLSLTLSLIPGGESKEGDHKVGEKGREQKPGKGVSWNKDRGREAWDIPGAPSSLMASLQYSWACSGLWVSSPQGQGAWSPLSILLLVSVGALDTKHAELTVACRIPQPEAMPGRLRCSCCHRAKVLTICPGFQTATSGWTHPIQSQS